MKTYFFPRILTLVAATFLFSGTVPGLAQEVPPPMVFEESGETRDLYLKGAKLTVTGSDNTIRVMSNCSALVVIGSGNVIQVMAVDKIDLVGSNNQITWSAGITNDEPTVSDKGKDNTVQAGSVEGD